MPILQNEEVHYSFEEIRQNIDGIARQMAVRHVTSIDAIIAIGTGGWIPGKLLKDRLSTEERPVPAYSLGIINYGPKKKMLPHPRIYQPLPLDLNLENKTILLVDEVADSGISIIKALEHLQGFKPKKAYTSVLHQKEASLYCPDFVGEHVGNKWIVYPWE